MGKRLFLLLLLAAFLPPHELAAQSRIKDIADVEGVSPTPVIGYGIVVGLDGTGDSPRSLFTNQTLRNMLERFGISMANDRVRVRNVAGVMVTAELSPFAKQGQKVDVTISSIGDSRSLQGGTLLLTPLAGPDGEVYGLAQGPLSIGGFAIESGGVSIRQNAASVGRIPGGMIVEREPGASLADLEEVNYSLREPDYTTARRIAEAINQALNLEIAEAVDPVSVRVTVPPGYKGGAVGLVTDTENVLVNPDVPAKVVVNERTGTVVIGEKVQLSSVAISHGALSISIVSTPVISQPGAFSPGRTVSQQASQIQVQQQGTGVVVVQQSASVGDVAAALNSLGVAPRDIIAIFQALKQAGALRAELVII